MNAMIDSPQSVRVADSAAIRVTVIYEDFLSGARAKRFAERLAEGLDSLCPLSESMWRSDLLDCPSIALEAATAAEDCEYLIVSLRGDRVLSPATSRWIEAQLNGAAGRLACVIALLGSGDGTSRIMEGNRQYLRGVCAANRVEFCAHAGMASVERTIPDFSVRRCLPAPLDD
jgi:hypothetical protein